MVLAPFGAVTAAVVTFALAAMATFLILAIMKSLGGVPVIGGYVVGWAQRISQAITNACGHLFGGIAHLVGGGLHQAAVYLNETWGVMRKGPAVIAHIANVVGTLVYHVTGLKALVHEVRKLAHTIARRFVVLGREIYHLQHRVTHLAHEIAQGIGEDVLPRIRSLDRELNSIKNKVIPAIEGDVVAVETDLTALGKWVKDNALVAGTAAFAGAVAWALSRLGLGGLRCNSLRNNMDKRGCSMWGAMDDLLGLVALGLAAGEFEELVKEAQSLTNVATTVFDDVFGLSR